MKKIMMIALAAAMFCSCAKDNDPATVTPPQPEEGMPVHLTFGNTDSFTRAVFDNTTAAEPWEKTINSMTVYAYNKGEQVMRKSFSAEDIATMSTDFVVPGLTAGESVTFYVIANRSRYDNNMRESDFYSFADNDCMDYNGTFNAVTTGCLRSGGFALSGKTTATMKTDGSTNYVSVTLKRSVAKVAVKIGIDPTFSQRYHGGTIKVLNMTLTTKAIMSSYIFDNYNSRHIDHTMQRNLGQIPEETDGQYYALFYLFEQGQPAYGTDEKAKLIVQAQFAQDDNYYSGGDTIMYYYTIELDGSGGGEIKRNGYYRITATIKDLDALHVNSAFEVSEWEVPTTTDYGNITIGS